MILNGRGAFYPAILFAALVLDQGSAIAAEGTGPRRILDVGCHNTDGTCYVTLDGTSFGASLGCAKAPTTQFRFDNGDTAIGKRSYASFLSAFLSGKSVSVYLEGCTSQGFPKLIYFNLVN